MRCLCLGSGSGDSGLYMTFWRRSELAGADFFDLGWSPLFNSLPVLRDRLLQAGPPRDYLMRWVDVPSLEVSASEQRYEPLGNGVVRFSAGDFVSDITFDADGLVVNYPGIGARARGLTGPFAMLRFSVRRPEVRRRAADAGIRCARGRGRQGEAAR